MIIATRQLKVRTSSGDTNVEIRLFKPTNEDGMWVCNYEIDWPGGTKKSFAAGADAIQAIFLALQKVGIQLYTSDYHRSGGLYWSGSGGGYGFPVGSSLRDLLVGDDSNL
jgi:hypothetical protein